MSCWVCIGAAVAATFAVVFALIALGALRMDRRRLPDPEVVARVYHDTFRGEGVPGWSGLKEEGRVARVERMRAALRLSGW